MLPRAPGTCRLQGHLPRRLSLCSSTSAGPLTARRPFQLPMSQHGRPLGEDRTHPLSEGHPVLSPGPALARLCPRLSLSFPPWDPSRFPLRLPCSSLSFPALSKHPNIRQRGKSRPQRASPSPALLCPWELWNLFPLLVIQDPASHAFHPPCRCKIGPTTTQDSALGPLSSFPRPWPIPLVPRLPIPPVIPYSPCCIRGHLCSHQQATALMLPLLEIVSSLYSSELLSHFL